MLKNCEDQTSFGGNIEVATILPVLPLNLPVLPLKLSMSYVLPLKLSMQRFSKAPPIDHANRSTPDSFEFQSVIYQCITITKILRNMEL